MTQTIQFVLALVFLNSCSSRSTEQNSVTDDRDRSDTERIFDTLIEPNGTKDGLTERYSSDSRGVNEIPLDGTYRFDIAFAEWQGKSMEEKVTVVIKGDSIQVVYEGDGKLTLVGKGEVIDAGRIMMHKSGNWIIAKDKSQIELDEVGGCSGGPTTIDFKNKKYWMC